MTNISWRYVKTRLVNMLVYNSSSDVANLIRLERLTGRASHPSSTPSSLSQLSAPIVGSILEAKCRIDSRTTKATRTGFGSVLLTKLSRVSK